MIEVICDLSIFVERSHIRVWYMGKKTKKKALKLKTFQTKEEFAMPYLKGGMDINDPFVSDEYDKYVHKYEEKLALLSKCQQFIDDIKKLSIKQVCSEIRQIVIEEVEARIEHVLSSGRLSMSAECFRSNYVYRKYRGSRLVEESEIVTYVRNFPQYSARSWPNLITNTAKNGRFAGYLYHVARTNSSALKEIINQGQPYKNIGMYDPETDIKKKFDSYYTVFVRQISSEVEEYFTPECIESCIIRNPYYGNIYRENLILERKANILRQNMLKQIPDTYPELFPSARAMKRHFILHVGPTNSGKTYAAVSAFEEGKRCTYLAPLRLLAYEQFESLNRNGIICSLRTGEERIDVPGAECVASTIEMASIEDEWDIAVIDEGQMINDSSRGGAWSAALLGLVSSEIHVCLAPEAEKIYIQLIEECGDTYEVIHHNRLCPLRIEKKDFNFPQDVQEGDALIVFSRRDVHAVASELQRYNIKTSVIYGRLPYDVRHGQAADFSEGNTKVLVATDAIGMGLNLPIQRVVFLELEKFDGTGRRDLRPDEIRQIAGRAGRKGLYHEGIVTSEYGRKMIRDAFTTALEDIDQAVIAFPQTLINMDAHLEDILKRWDEIPAKAGFAKEDMKEKLVMCHAISDISEDNEFLYKCITIAFDSENEYLFDLWKELCTDEARGREPKVGRYIPDAGSQMWQGNDLEWLEEQFRLCDLLYGFCDKFRHDEWTENIMRCKKQLSEQITTILNEQHLKGRTCKRCGRKLPWKYPHAVCERCFEERRYR